MICLEEVKATCKRLQIIKNNCDNAEEKYACDILYQNINNMIKQLEPMITTEDFKQLAKDTYKE